MATRSKIGASSYSRWGSCPGSVKLSEGIPKSTSSFAEEGTRAHELAEKILLSKAAATTVDDEMLEYVSVYTDYVNVLSLDAEYVGIEEKFALTSLHPDLYGTADAVVYKDKILYVIDLKYGQGIAVEAEHNKQLQFYALGALMKLNLPCSAVEMVIVQPRCFHSDGPIRSWRIPVIDLLDFSADLLEAALRTEEENPSILPGDWCRFCPAAAICPALHSTAIETAKVEFSPSLTYDPQTLADTLGKLGAIEGWIKSVKEFAYREAQAGRLVPGYKLVPRRANRKWSDENAAESVLLMEIGLSPQEIFKPQSLKSPAQIEALLTTKEDKTLLESIVVKESSGDTLAPVTDKRKTSKSAIETEFTKIEENIHG